MLFPKVKWTNSLQVQLSETWVFTKKKKYVKINFFFSTIPQKNIADKWERVLCVYQSVFSL